MPQQCVNWWRCDHSGTTHAQATCCLLHHCQLTLLQGASRWSPSPKSPLQPWSMARCPRQCTTWSTTSSSWVWVLEQTRLASKAWRSMFSSSRNFPTLAASARASQSALPTHTHTQSQSQLQSHNQCCSQSFLTPPAHLFVLCQVLGSGCSRHSVRGGEEAPVALGGCWWRPYWR